MSPSVLLLPGDGIGPEVVDAARRVLEAVRPDVATIERAVGLSALERHGVPYEDDLIEVARDHDAILLGAVGGATHDVRQTAPAEAALFALRKELDLFTNLRPIRAIPALASRSPLREEYVGGVDFLLVRELTGGLYFGEGHLREAEAFDTCAYSRAQIDRVLGRAFELAQGRHRRLASVDKANVLRTGALWRRCVDEMAPSYPDVETEHLLVDNAAMQLLLRAKTFDVVVTENLFGDILSDEVSLLAGGLGMLPSASVGDGSPALYEPAHGSAPDIAGKGIANPCAAILSVALLLRHTLQDEDAAATIEAAVDQSLAAGVLTRDLGGTASTEDLTGVVLSNLPGG